MNSLGISGVAGLSFATPTTVAPFLQELLRTVKQQARARHQHVLSRGDEEAILRPGRLWTAIDVLRACVSDHILPFVGAVNAAAVLMRRDWRPLSTTQRAFTDDLMLAAINCEIERTLHASDSADGLQRRAQEFLAASAKCRGFSREQLLEAARIFPETAGLTAVSDTVCDDDDPPHDGPLWQVRLGVEEQLDYMRCVRQPWKPLARLHPGNFRDQFPAVTGDMPVPAGWIDDSCCEDGYAAFRRGLYRLFVQVDRCDPVRIAGFGESSLPLALIHEAPSTARVMLLATDDWVMMLGLLALLPPSGDLLKCP